jgi:AraC-like DNA-binding protein
LLARSNTPLGDIALALGYPDQSAFSRAFRRWSGQSPRSWRLAQRSAAALGSASPARPPAAT